MRHLGKIGTHTFLIIASFLSLFPFYWMLVGTTNNSADITKGNMTFGGELMNNVRELLENTTIVQGFFNSLYIALIGTVLTLILSSMAGYGFEIYRSKGKDRLFGVLMLSMMMPFAAIMIPLFKMFSGWGLLNSAASIIIPGMTSAFMIFFFMQNTKSFPRELMQAGQVDGLNEWQLFIRVYMPTMKPTYAAAAIITFMANWNNYLWPLIALQTNEKKTLPLIISSLNSSYNPDYGIIMVAIVLSTLPTILIFFILQKQFVQGMLGSVK